MSRHRTATLALLVPATLGAAGACGGERGPAPAGTPAADPAEPAGAVAPTRYLSGFAFTGAVTGGSQLYLELVNETSESALARDYRGWLSSGDGWERLLTLRDTVPVPRAAWRILPGGGLRVLVGDGSRIVGLAYTDSARRLRLQPTRVIADWTGPTGQRELLAEAVLRHDSLSQPGLLFFRRAARAPGGPADGGPDRLLLLGDTRGNGLLVADAGPDTTVSGFAWGWIDGARSRWTDAELLAAAPAAAGEAADTPAAADALADRAIDPDGASAADGGRESWTLRIPSAGILGRLRAVGATGAEGATLLLVAGTLEADGGSRPVRGLILRGRLP